MENWKKRLVGCVSVVAVISLALAGASWADGEEQPSKWSEAGKEIGEAADAVGGASKESYEVSKEKTIEMLQKAKEESAEAWSKTKEKSGEAWDATKETSGEVADATVETSKETWEKTKEKSAELIDKARQSVHEATAPPAE